MNEKTSTKNVQNSSKASCSPASNNLESNDEKSSFGKDNTRLSPSSELELRCIFPRPAAESLLAKNYPDLVELILEGKFPLKLQVFLNERRLLVSSSDVALSAENKNELIDKNVSELLEKAAVDYLLQAGNTVPIAKTWVGNEIKKKWAKFSPLGVFGVGGGNSYISTIREV